VASHQDDVTARSASATLEPVSKRTRALAWSLAALALLAVAATATMVVLNRSAIHSLDEANPIELVLPIAYSIMGALVATRRPRNPIGWIFLGLALFGGLPGLSQQYLLHDLRIHTLPLAAWVAWTHDWILALVFPAGLATFFFLLFPDGRFASRRWRRLGWVAVALTAAGIFADVTQRTIELTQGTRTLRIRSPIGLKLNLANGPFGWIYWMGGIAILASAIVGTVLRMRRATGEERQQLKWLAYAAVGTIAGIVANIVGFIFDPHLSNAWFDLVILLGFGVAVPLSCGVAMLKHGLYEIDVVVNKTVVYAILAAFFTAVYVAVVVGIGAAIGSTRNPFLTVLAAAVIALAFNPVRDRAKRFANRIVYGRRATPYEVLSEFAERMAGTYSLEDVLPRMARILGEGTGARRASVWLRVGRELRPAALWGDEVEGTGPQTLRGEELPAMPDVTKVVAVRDAGELLGALSVTKPPNEPLALAEDKLVDDLGAQAGLVLRNVRLTEELRANLVELQASRQRIVAAQDEARRRLERNIHDGAQQQLVSLAVQVRLAESMAGRDPEGERDLLGHIQQGLQEAMEDLRDLARGIYPPLLADQGLVAALRAQARKAPLPVEIEADDLGRYPQELEAAVYFCALEALQNVSKYAGASKASVRLSQTDGHLTFEVEDDGAGFDASNTSYGTGLQGMADRLSALGGNLDVRSEPGSGTRVTGRLPVARIAAT
jgi:signal transduction histidine kinase